MSEPAGQRPGAGGSGAAPDAPGQHPGAGGWVPDGAGIAGLRAAAAVCRGCELAGPASQTVFSSGSATARVALVGEQPGDQEDRAGAPFVGPAGRLLDRALSEVGIDRADCYVTNAVKHFRFSQDGPRARRIHQTPDAWHVQACRPWLTAELRVLDPPLVVCLGATAARALLGPQARVGRDRGRLLARAPLAGEPAGRSDGWLLVTVHPSSVLRATDQDGAYAALLDDLRVAASLLSAQPG